MIRVLLVLLACCIARPSFAADETVNVGFGGFNSFTFEVPFETVVFPPRAPIKGEVIRMNSDRTVLVEFDSAATDPIQMVVSLANEQVLTFQLMPSSGSRPVTWKQQAFAGADTFRTPIQRPEDKWLQDVFYTVVQGQTPDGFTRIPPPSAGTMGELTAQYIAAFRNEAYVLLVAKLQSSVLKWIAPQDLYVPGVKAVLVDGDRVGVKDAPIAYVLIAGTH